MSTQTPSRNPKNSTPTRAAKNKYWLLTLGVIGSVIWIILVFTEMVEDNKRIREAATAQVAHNRTYYENIRQRFSVEVEKWARNACGSEARKLSGLPNRFDEKKCLLDAVNEHSGPGYPGYIERCLLIDKAAQLDIYRTQKYEVDYVWLLAAVKSCDIPPDPHVSRKPDPPAARGEESFLEYYLPLALLPPLSLALLAWAAVMIRSFIRRPNVAVRIHLVKSGRPFRYGASALLIYEFWLGFWAIFSGGWEYRYWPEEWLILAVAVPAGGIITYFIYRWAIAQNIDLRDKKQTRQIDPIISHPENTAQALEASTSEMTHIDVIPRSDSISNSAVTATDAPLLPESKLSNNYLMRHWRGDLSLPVSYWVNGTLLATIISALLLFTVGAIGGSYSLRVSASASLATMILSILVWLWSIVGIWRSSDRHVARGGSFTWAAVAKIMVIIGAIAMVGKISVNILPQVKELTLIAGGADPIGSVEIKVVANGKALIVRGSLGDGAAEKVQSVLTALPDVTWLELNSNGGRLFEAQQLMKTVRNRNLNTYVQDQCVSACTIVFLAGKERAMASDARIGFHQPSFPGVDSNTQISMTREMMEIYQSAGLPKTFIQRIEMTAHKDMWFPSRDELIAAKVITRPPIGPINRTPGSID